jgi:hypothetical protein
MLTRRPSPPCPRAFAIGAAMAKGDGDLVALADRMMKLAELRERLETSAR